MCGICGAVDWSESPDAATLVRRMNPTMVHRGPDDEGYLDVGISDFGLRNAAERHSAVSLSLGMRRLSIIDLGGGHQPIFNEDGKVGVVLNGEIYNFQELQQQLKDRGHTFRTRSDSEVIAHAYEEWGSGCVERLQGMFAFAVSDRRKLRDDEPGGTLFLARDRLGIKPLYYTAGSVQSPTSKVQSPATERGHWTLDVGHWTRFAFASEVRTLLASGVVARQLSRAAVESYLLFGSVSEPMTLVEGIRSLPPGHTLTIDLGAPQRSASIKRYWQIADEPAGNAGSPAGQPRWGANGHAVARDVATAAKSVRSLLEQSVRGHLIADVPVGVFLSSGIDSTTLAALASREVSGVHTFTVAFEEDKFSEATIARRTAERFQTTHSEVVLTGDEMLAQLGAAVGALDQPTIDGINTYFVSASARAAGLKVALSGLGGDEVFGGYSTFSRTPQYQRLARVGNRVPAAMRSVVASAMASAGGRFMSGDAARKVASLWSDSESLPDPFYFGRALFTPAQVSELLNGGSSTAAEPAWWNWLNESATRASKLDAFGAVSCMEAESYLVNTLLRDADSMSMAHSLEVRVPFLDHPLVEYVTHLPQQAKLSSGTPKALLVAAVADLLPDEVVHQTKRGFTFPWEEWLRGPLRKTMEQGFSELSPALQGALSAENARGVWQAYLGGNTSWSRPWSLYVLNEWTKTHL